MKTTPSFTTLMFAALCALPVSAQVKVDTPGARVVVGKDASVNVEARDITTVATDGNTASVNVGGIGQNASIQGVTVINGKVWIDGEEVPPGAKRYKSRSGAIYRIERKNGAVSVTNE